MSATTARSVTAIRRVPLPAIEPPYDAAPDEPAPPPRPEPGKAAGPHDTQGTLALAYALPGGVPAVPAPPASLRLVDVGAATEEPAGADLALTATGPRLPTGSSALPDPRRWSARLAQGIVEALEGHRPMQQLVRWTDESVYTMLARRLAAGRRGDRPRPIVRSVRICEPRDGVVEAGVVVGTGNRCRALALRLEGLGGRWCCTALEIL